eukprot:Nk52_evm18s539 gene=Nk52_evmTU18s539
MEPTHVGLYTGMLSCSFPLGVAIGGYFWGLVVDRVGSKVVVVVSLTMSIICNIGIGLAPNYWVAFSIKLTSGVFNGIETVLKSYVGRITTGENQAAGFSAIILAWGFGTVLSPYVSGILAKPATRFPTLFAQHDFWKNNEYFLPCLSSAVLSFIAIVATIFYMNEIGPANCKKQDDDDDDDFYNYGMRKKKSKISALLGVTEPFFTSGSNRRSQNNHQMEEWSSSQTNLLDNNDHHPHNTALLPHPSTTSVSSSSFTNKDKTNKAAPSHAPVANASLPAFKKNMFICACLYSWIVYCILVLDETVPLFAKSEIEKGGLNYSIQHIGIVVSIDGMANIIGVLLFIPQVMKRFGTLTCFRIATGVLVPTIALYPAMNTVARLTGSSLNAPTWAVVVCLQFIKGLCASIMFTAGMVFLSNSVPSEYKGKANGISTSISAFLKVLGPCYAGSLWSLILYDLQGMDYCEYVPFFIYAVHILLALIWGCLIDKRLTQPYEEIHVTLLPETEEKNEERRETNKSNKYMG